MRRKEVLNYMRRLLQPFKQLFFGEGKMDIRIALVLSPLLIAAGWAGFNIFRAALGQVQDLLNKNNAV